MKELLIFLLCLTPFLAKAQNQTETARINEVLNSLLVNRESKTYVYKYFIPIKFLEPILSNVDFIDNLYGICGTLNQKKLKVDDIIKSNKDTLLENINSTTYSKIRNSDLHRDIKLTSNHSKNGIIYISKPIFLKNSIFIYYRSKYEAKILFLDIQTLKLLCVKYFYLNIEN